ncbi:T-cell surface antigen CD2 [Chelonia mydas]|uniref:T-cell surface antigen CD2 n=1 Tax=Chelonia mydas TaxID=8469 RepID=UPI001CA95D32|nr:T-cell surface antigen CD2 [Chelonia mydas]
MSPSFAFQFTLCALIILQVHGDVTTVNGILDGFVTFHLDYPDFERTAQIIWKKGNTLLYNRTYHMTRFTVFSNGTSALKNTKKEDEGQYTVSVYNITGNLVYQRIFQLHVHEPTQIPAVNVSSHIDGGRELLCESANRSRVCFHWMLNGQLVGLIEIEDDGKKIILEKGLPGKLVCQIHHENNIGESSLIKLECKEGDLLKQPLFLYTLAACGGGAIVLAVIASLITFCCLKSKQQFIPVPSEEEKEEGLTMSVISNEETKSPPNGDHHEALSAPDDSPPNPESTETCQGLEAEPKMEAESEVTPDPEVVVDINNEECVCDSFPDPIDP